MTDFVYTEASGEENLLRSRIDDYLLKAERGETAVSAFLDLRQQTICRNALCSLKRRHERDFLFFGGYEAAERRCLYVFPDYLTDLYPQAEEQSRYLREQAGASGAVSAIKIMGSGYRELSHRDYLGSLMGLGIERSVIGDIVPLDPYTAVVFFCGKIEPFLLESLEKVGSDTVRKESMRAQVEDGSFTCAVQRPYTEITDTVSSPRLDCVLAALLSLSRERAQRVIESGAVEIDFKCCQKSDAQLPGGCYLSVRGSGRFFYCGTEGENRKGRLRIRAKKFI